ncbi:MAG TPA: glycosyltransferase, partial [Burkholderiales bacterium]|nr:glycosyltransferase [Burkholderiales bacterium]
PPPEYADLPGPRAVYAGALDDRFDFEQMHALAQLPLQIVLIGPATPNASGVLGSLPNVHLLGPRPYRSLPGYLQHAQIGLLPLTRHPANEGRSPMKLFEYGAAGLPVIASATRELKRRALPFVRLAENSESFIEHARELIEAEATRVELAKIARQHSAAYAWAGRAQLLLDNLKRCESPPLHREVA